MNKDFPENYTNGDHHTSKNKKSINVIPEQMEIKHPSFLQNIRDSKRRLIQQFLVKIGKAEKTDDHEYIENKNNFLAFYHMIKDINMQIKSYISNLVALGYGCSLLGDDLGYIKSKKSINVDTNALKEDTPLNPFVISMKNLDIEARQMGDQVMIHVIHNIQKKLDKMKDIKKLMKERENLKLDYDSAVRRFKMEQEKGTRSNLVKREVKVQNARKNLINATENVIKQFQYYESIREQFLDDEIENFATSQAKFFSFCVSSFHSEFQKHSTDSFGDTFYQKLTIHETVTPDGKETKQKAIEYRPSAPRY